MIVLKSDDEIKRMAESCRIVAEVLEGIKRNIAPGVATKELDEFAESFILSKGAQPAFKGYRGYPASVCTSINEQVVHGIPSSAKLRNGDIISLDIGVCYKGFYGDAAVTVPVGSVDNQAMKLLSVTEKALETGLEKSVAGNRLSDVSFAIQEYVESEGFSVVRNFVGHGIGRELHEEPQVPNFGKPGEGPRLLPGMTLAIEPMVNAGNWEVVILNDGWTAVTKDKSLSAHFEHTVAITKNGLEILTKI
ncbi:MAG TPA: type I methionyl aminopeptidase [Nitrospirae bacterium]|nr:methionine aminopeptidase 1 [bacterium BMS3Abin06]HDH13336.1 type I methionyl aminopeptidase [Nitrospirota bacterium]HDZ00338.1 type I methionyl aminopeptidase [Nitrospirota bacterium]